MKRRLSRKQIGGGFNFILYSEFADKGPYSSAHDYQKDAFNKLNTSADDVNYIDVDIPPSNKGQREIKFKLERIENNPNVYKLIRPGGSEGFLRGSQFSAAYISRLVDDFKLMESVR